MQLFLVVVPKNNNAAKAKALIDEMYNDYKNKKATFDQLKIKAQASNGEFQAGDMYVSKNQTAATQLGMDYGSLLALFQKPIGDLSEVTETSIDYQFYVIRDKYEAKMLTLSDLVQPGTTVTVYEYIKQGLTAQKQNEYFVTATAEVSESLRTPENFQMVRTGDALDKLLSGW